MKKLAIIALVFVTTSISFDRSALAMFELNAVIPSRMTVARTDDSNNIRKVSVGYSMLSRESAAAMGFNYTSSAPDSIARFTLSVQGSKDGISGFEATFKSRFSAFLAGAAKVPLTFAGVVNSKTREFHHFQVDVFFPLDPNHLYHSQLKALQADWEWELFRFALDSLGYSAEARTQVRTRWEKILSNTLKGSGLLTPEVIEVTGLGMRGSSMATSFQVQYIRALGKAILAFGITFTTRQQAKKFTESKAAEIMAWNKALFKMKAPASFDNDELEWKQLVPYDKQGLEIARQVISSVRKHFRVPEGSEGWRNMEAEFEEFIKKTPIDQLEENPDSQGDRKGLAAGATPQISAGDGKISDRVTGPVSERADAKNNLSVTTSVVRDSSTPLSSVTGSTEAAVPTVASANACSVCQATGTKLKTCSRCRSKKYCGLTCQAADWNAGHKQVCQKKD